MISSTLKRKDSAIRTEENIEKIRLFLQRLFRLRDLSSIEILQIEYIGEMSLQGEEMVHSDLIFRKNNSLYSRLSLYVPVNVRRDIFKNVKNSEMGTDIDQFFKYVVRTLSDSIVFLYNSANPRSYLTKYRNDIPVLMSNGFDKKNIYKVVFEIFGKEETVYFDIDEPQLFAKYS